MTISAYQVDNVIKAYSKQQRIPIRRIDSLDGPAVPSDTVTLSGNRYKDDDYQQISYSILDLLKK